jgi:hypothetical protein
VNFATLFTPSGPQKPCQNANMRVVFSEGGLKNRVRWKVFYTDTGSERIPASLFQMGKELRSSGYIQGCGILLDEIDIYQEVDIDHFLCNLQCLAPCPAIYQY